MTTDAIANKEFYDIDIKPWTGTTPDEVLGLGASEYSVEQAKDIVQSFAAVSTSCNVDNFIQGFTEDSVTSFNEHSDIKGRAALRAFMVPRFEYFSRPGTRYACRKTLRALTGNVFGVVWVNHWYDTETGKLNRSKGFEFWTMRDGLIARWDAAIVAWVIPRI